MSLESEVGRKTLRLTATGGSPAAALVKDGKIVWRGHPATIKKDAIKKQL